MVIQFTQASAFGVAISVVAYAFAGVLKVAIDGEGRLVEADPDPAGMRRALAAVARRPGARARTPCARTQRPSSARIEARGAMP